MNQQSYHENSTCGITTDNSPNAKPISPVRFEKKKKYEIPEKVIEEVEVLSLAPFSPIPKLSFDNIKVGSVATRQLLIKNPTDQDVNLFLSRLLPEDLNVSYSWKNKTIESGGETVFELTWCPSDEGSSRHLISFADTRKIKRDIPVTFKSVKKIHDTKLKSTKTKQKISPKKLTTKYYSTRPTRISPRKYTTSPKRNPTLKKYSPSPVKNNSPIYKKHVQPSHSTVENRLAKPTHGNKENIPSNYLDASRASDVFVSPKNVSFLLDDLQPEFRRGTYVLQNNNKISPVSEFDDSLEKASPVASPSFLQTNTSLFEQAYCSRPPLGTHNGVNLPLFNNYPQRYENGSRTGDYGSNDFAHKLNNRDSFCFTPSTTPDKQPAALPTQIHIGTLNITSLLEDTSRNRTYEWPCPGNLNISSETYTKFNTSCDTYVKSNLSGATYTRDSSIGDLNSLNISPLPTKVSPGIQKRVSPKQFGQQRCSSPFDIPYADTDKAKKTHLNFFSGVEKQELSRIEEESYFHSINSRDSTKMYHNTMKRRKLDEDLTVTSPKQPVACSAKDWSKKGGAALRISKKTSGLTLSNFKYRPTEENNGPIMEISKKDTNTVIIQNPFILAATTMVDPFMTPQLYVSDQWIDQQEVDLKKWLNALLTPPQELSSEERVIDVAKVWQECKRREVDVVPTKETISNNYHTNTKLNSLRKTAQNLFRSPEMSVVLSKVVQAVDSGKLSVRTDKDIHLNLILKSEIIGLLLSYNSLWLRIALETVYNEVIPLNSNSDIVGLSTFIVNRVIKDPYLIRKFKSTHSPKYAAEFKKFFLKKFLILVYFLDQAKHQKLIPHDPCLFRKNGGVKESKELLLSLARETLFAVGDITKFLKFLGYTVTHVQTYIHEFDYAVNNLGVDLRDGVRLSKIMEIILMRSDLLNTLRVPAISRLQKIYNMKVVFDSLKEAGYKMLYDISPKDIVDGHREKTLSFLWQIIYKFEAPLMVKSVTTIQNWFRSLPVVLKRRRLQRILMKKENAAKKIQCWYKRQKLSRKLEHFLAVYKQYVEDLRRCRAAVQIQSCYRKHVCQKSYKYKLQTIVNIQRICRGYLVRNIKTVQIKSAVIIQSYVKMYIVRKEYLKLKQSTLLIQARYRAKTKMKLQKYTYIKLKSAVTLIQQRFRANNLASDQRQRYLQLRSAVISVQTRFRANKSCKIERQNYNKTKSAAITIQTWYRSVKEMRFDRQQFLCLKRSVTFVENRFLALKSMRIERRHFLLVRTACITIQLHYRAWISMRTERNQFTELKSATLCLQQRYRAKKAMERELLCYKTLRDATVFIQRRFRANKCMKIEQTKFIEIYNATKRIQLWYRATFQMRTCRTNYLSLKYAVRILEDRYEARVLMKEGFAEFRKLRSTTILLQRKYRALVAMRSEKNKYCQLKSATILIQRRFRSNKLAQSLRAEYLNLKQAAVVIQTRFRARRDMHICSNKFVLLKKTTVMLQRRVRANNLMVIARDRYKSLLKQATFIQRKFRANQMVKLNRKDYLNLKRATIVIQRRFRAQRDMRISLHEFVLLKKTTVMLQRRVRANKIMTVARESYMSLLKHTIYIQRKFRANRLAYLHRTNYLNMKRAAVVVQSRFRARREMRKCLHEFVQLKETTVMLQRRVRANKMMALARESYKSLLKQTIFIQRTFRANRLAQLHRVNYLNLKLATVFIQRRFRAQRDMRICLHKYVLLKKSAVMMQRRFRANKMMIFARDSYMSLLKQTIFIQRKFRANRLAHLHRMSYLYLKQATILIQRRFRAQREMQIRLNEFVQLKKTTIMLQRKVRANKMMSVAQESYKSILKQTIFIQRKFRANKLAHSHRTKYLELKHATVVIQRHFRAQISMRICTHEFVLLKKTTIMLQRRVRANNMMMAARDAYKSLIKHTILVQRTFRANKLKQLHRTNYVNLKQATLVIQRRFRAQRDMQICLNKFVALKKTVVMVQRKFRAIYAMKLARNFYKSLRNAAIVIQNRWRAEKLSKLARNRFLELKHATVVVQQQWRAKKLGMKDKQEFEAIKDAAVVIQRRWRALKSGRQVRNDYLQLKIATLAIQRMWRAKISMKIHSRNYSNLKNAVIILQRRYRAQVLMKMWVYIYKKKRNASICIQRFYRGYMEMKVTKAEYELKKKTIARIQCCIKGYMVRKKYAHYFTPEAREQRRIEKQRNEAAVCIQANWRGYKSRSTEPRDCSKIRKRMQKANADVIPEKTLESRSRVAVQTFANRSSTLFHIIKALEDIDYVTRRSESQCIEMSQLLPGQLYIMLGATSRSLPEMTACIHSVNILINICKLPATKKYSFVPEYMDNLLAVMLHWCDKDSQLFPTLCTLLWLFAHTPQWKRNILKLPSIDQRLKRIQGMVSRKENMVKRSASKVVSHFSPSRNLPMPSLLPDWGLDYASNPYVFTNSVHAFNSLLSILNI